MSEANCAVPCESKEIKFSQSDIERFWSKVDKSGGEDVCWIWKEGKCRNGYGKFWAQNMTIRAHRASFIISKGKIPSDKPYVCHTCDNPSCVNPRHLFAGSNMDNVNDMISKGRIRIGDRCGAAKLTDSQAMMIIELLKDGKHTHRWIAGQFGVHRTTVSLIANGKTWFCITKPDSQI